VTDKEP